MGCVLIGPVGVGLLLDILDTANRSITITVESRPFEPASRFNDLHEETFRYQMGRA